VSVCVCVCDKELKNNDQEKELTYCNTPDGICSNHLRKHMVGSESIFVWEEFYISSFVKIG